MNSKIVSITFRLLVLSIVLIVIGMIDQENSAWSILSGFGGVYALIEFIVMKK